MKTRRDGRRSSFGKLTRTEFTTFVIGQKSLLVLLLMMVMMALLLSDQCLQCFGCFRRERMFRGRRVETSGRMKRGENRVESSFRDISIRGSMTKKMIEIVVSRWGRRRRWSRLGFVRRAEKRRRSRRTEESFIDRWADRCRSLLFRFLELLIVLFSSTIQRFSRRWFSIAQTGQFIEQRLGYLLSSVFRWFKAGFARQIDTQTCLTRGRGCFRCCQCRRRTVRRGRRRRRRRQRMMRILRIAGSNRTECSRSERNRLNFRRQIGDGARKKQISSDRFLRQLTRIGIGRRRRRWS